MIFNTSNKPFKVIGKYLYNWEITDSIPTKAELFFACFGNNSSVVENGCSYPCIVGILYVSFKNYDVFYWFTANILVQEWWSV